MKRQTWLQKTISISAVLLTAGLGATTLVAQPAPPDAQGPAPLLNAQQLDNLVAPIALYPDPLLGQVLAASTYPVELVEAQQWLQANNSLQGQSLADAARGQSWDASVQAMVAMPDVLAKLNQDIRWTTDLGNAFLAQPSDVMAAVQRMRARAQANGKLQSTPQEVVTTATQNGQTAIEIEPADPDVIYVPNYNPVYVWGAPAWGYYPTLLYPDYGWGWYPPCYISSFYVGWGGWGWRNWGWGPNWWGGGLYVNVGFFNRWGYHYGPGFGRYTSGYRGTYGWSHDPGHRLGVGYSTRGLNDRFGEASRASRFNSIRNGNIHTYGSNGSNRGFEGSRNQGRQGGNFQGSQGSQGSRYQGGNQQGTGGNQRFGGNQGSGNYQRFGGNQGTQDNQRYQGNQATPGAGNNQRYQGNQGTPGAGNNQRYQGSQSTPNNGGYQRFNGRQEYQAPAAPAAPAQRFGSQAVPQQQPRYNAPSAPQQRYSAPSMPQRQYSAPSMPRYSAPSTQSAPRYSAPSAPRYSAPSGGGGARSFGGGGGGSRSFGGGGGSHGGGGGHGRR